MILKYNNFVFLFIQLIIVILSINFITKDICNKFDLTPGSNFVTKNSKSSWQIIKSKIYNNETLSDFSKIEYYHIYSYLQDEYPVFKGHITLFDDNKDIFAVFNKFLLQLPYYDFIFNFNKYVDMKNETYKIDVKEGLLYLMFLNNCTNNFVLYEKDNNCLIKDEYNNNINIFIEDFFNEKIELPDYCYNNHYFYKLLYILSKFTLVFIILNIFTYIIPFIIRFFKKFNIINHNNEYIPLN